METKNQINKSFLTIFLLSIVLFSFTFVSAVELEPVKQGDDALLYQTCNNCTYCNITRVTNEVGTLLLGNTEFNQEGTYYSYNLLGGNTTTLGTYNYCYDRGNSVDSQTGCINFPVTPSGRNGNNNIALFILLTIMIYVVTFVSFFGRNIELSILTGMMMSFFGVWIINNGMMIYRDSLTNYFGYVTIFIGGLIALRAAFELITD